MQKERDRRAGLNTAGYVTGYRGSPLGTLDQQFMRAGARLKANDVLFHAGTNEDLAATALAGSQTAELRGEGKFDGVFGMWYGKGPGVDRSGDAFRHANFAGTSKHGGVIALMGDDHTAKSSTTAHQSEYHFIDVMIPILNPAGVQEIMDYGLYGWAMSRFTGAWTALKCMHETVESTAVVDGSLDRVKIIIPDDFAMPPGGLNIRLGDSVLGQEARLHDFKRDAMLAFVRANKLNRMICSGGRNPKIGIITVGKSYLDVRQALRRARPRRGQMQRSRPAPLQDRLPMADQPPRPDGIRARPRPHHRGRGKALADRGPGPRRALRHRQPAGLHRQEGRARQLAVSRSRARSIPTTSPSASASACSITSAMTRSRRAWRGSRRRSASSPRPRTSPSAFPISARAARTIRRRWCRREAAPMPASAATTWPSGWIARPRATPRWAARAPTGSARRRSPRAPMCSRTSATAPTIIPARWRSAPPSSPASTSPTRSCSTTPSP